MKDRKQTELLAALINVTEMLEKYRPVTPAHIERYCTRILAEAREAIANSRRVDSDKPTAIKGPT